MTGNGNQVNLLKLDLKNSWKHIRWTYFWRVLVIWNLCAVVDEFVAAEELSRKIATSGLQNDAFLLANEDQLVANYAKWAKQFPKIQMFFGKSWQKWWFCNLKFIQKKRSSLFIYID